MGIDEQNLSEAYSVLKDYGNMSSPTILFVLQKIMEKRQQQKSCGLVFGAAFGPGLTLETFILE